MLSRFPTTKVTISIRRCCRTDRSCSSRWDNAPGVDAVNLYRMNPDGSALELLYGNESHDTGTNGEIVQFMQPRELEDGRIMTLMRPFTDTEGGGDLVVIDTPTYVENTQPTMDNAGLTGPAQASATINQVSTETGVPSVGGRYASVYPIQDGTGRPASELEPVPRA